MRRQWQRCVPAASSAGDGGGRWQGAVAERRSSRMMTSVRARRLSAANDEGGRQGRATAGDRRLRWPGGDGGGERGGALTPMRATGDAKTTVDDSGGRRSDDGGDNRLTYYRY